MRDTAERKGHPERCGNAARKGQNFHAELCPLFISPEIIGSRLDNGAASVFLGALGERHGGLQHALHCFWRKAPQICHCEEAGAAADSQLQTGGGSATMGRKRGRLPCWMCAIRA